MRASYLFLLLLLLWFGPPAINPLLMASFH